MKLQHACQPLVVLFILLFILLTSWSLEAMADGIANPAIHCRENPGFVLCRDIRVMKGYIMDCHGSCSKLYLDQIDALDVVSDQCFDVVLPGSEVAQDLALQAQEAAARICTNPWSAEHDSTLRHKVITAANRALDCLHDIQVAGAMMSPTYCRINAARQ